MILTMMPVFVFPPSLNLLVSYPNSLIPLLPVSLPVLLVLHPVITPAKYLLQSLLTLIPMMTPSHPPLQDPTLIAHPTITTNHPLNQWSPLMVVLSGIAVPHQLPLLPTNLLLIPRNYPSRPLFINHPPNQRSP
jgi:hypothetical protein